MYVKATKLFEHYGCDNLNALLRHKAFNEEVLQKIPFYHHGHPTSIKYSDNAWRCTVVSESFVPYRVTLNELHFAKLEIKERDYAKLLGEDHIINYADLKTSYRDRTEYVRYDPSSAVTKFVSGVVATSVLAITSVVFYNAYTKK